VAFWYLFNGIIIHIFLDGCVPYCQHLAFTLAFSQSENYDLKLCACTTQIGGLRQACAVPLLALLHAGQVRCPYLLAPSCSWGVETQVSLADLKAACAAGATSMPSRR
jgi:hypothetical protein